LTALPNFFLVGAPKAGTTSLYHYLDQHPQIFMSPIKEPCYFASEIRPENFADHLQAGIAKSLAEVQQYLSGPMTEKKFSGLVADWDDYQKLFRNADLQPAIGEASVCYLWSKTAARNIAVRLPDAKILMILRNPADRAWSQYQDSLSGGWPMRSFREEVQASIAQTGGKFDVTHPFLEHGLYHDQVKRYLDLFPAANIRIYWYEENISTILPSLFTFLNVDANFIPDTSQRHRVPRSILRRLGFGTRGSKPMHPTDRQLLIDYYRDDIHKLSHLLNRDLSAWLQVQA
jgi:hypothetical protein